MNFQPSLFIVVLGSLAAFLLGIAAALWARRALVQRIEDRCRTLQAQVDGVAHALSVADSQSQLLEREIGDVRRELAVATTRNEQLRDLVKVHVARRREFDEWAAPIKAALGETVAQSLHTVKAQLTRQEWVLQRQEQLAAESHAHYRPQRDEIERMRRELSIKNYHIAALNERFIRIEERIRDVCMQMAELPTQGAGTAQALADAYAGPPPTDRQTRLGPQDTPAEDWTQFLNEWHQRLDRRFAELDEAHADLRSRAAAEAAAATRFADVRPAGDAATIQ